jgi:hypothetical protein
VQGSEWREFCLAKKDAVILALTVLALDVAFAEPGIDGMDEASEAPAAQADSHVAPPPPPQNSQS